MVLRSSFFLTLLASLVARAGDSTHYTLEPGAIDCGGLHGTSAHYSADFSGSASGAGNSTTYTARSGYAGQLSDVAAIALAAPSLFVNESSTLQLSASVIFDDATTSPLDSSGIAWSVASGSLSGIDSTGLVTANVVYQDSAAQARGLYHSFTGTLDLTVLDSNPDNYGSYASDNIEDDWQVLYFGLNNPEADPAKDPDGDQQNNQFEHIAGLIPTDAGSVFSVQMVAVSGSSAQQAIVFGPTVSGRSYTVKSNEFLDSGTWLPLAASTTSDDGTERTVIDTGSTATTQFYTVEIVRD